MTRKIVAMWASSVGLSMLLAGCGIGAYPSAAAPKPPVRHTTAARASASRAPSSASDPSFASKSPVATPSTRATVPKSSANSSAPDFGPVVQEAMRYIAPRTLVYLEAPANIPIGRPAWYLGSSASAAPDGYQVQLQLTTTPLGLNSPHLTKGPNGGLAHDVGYFGATAFLTDGEAASGLTAAVDWSEPASSGLKDVSLGNGIAGKAWTRDGQTVVEWTEGDWTLQANGAGARAAVVVEASRVAAYLHTRLLPQTRGYLTVTAAGDGDHTEIAWQWGATDYDVSDYHSALAAITMAISMRPYPSHGRPYSADTPPFAGQHVVMMQGSHIAPAVPEGYPSSTSSNTTFSKTAYRPVEGFRGTLHGKPFILDFYDQYPVGQFIGVSYGNRPVYFGVGPSPNFYVLNFTGDDVVLGNTAAGTYMAINLQTGHMSTDVVSLKGFTGLVPPPVISGLPTTQYSVTIPYGPQ